MPKNIQSYLLAVSISFYAWVILDIIAFIIIQRIGKGKKKLEAEDKDLLKFKLRMIVYALALLVFIPATGGLIWNQKLSREYVAYSVLFEVLAFAIALSAMLAVNPGGQKPPAAKT